MPKDAKRTQGCASAFAAGAPAVTGADGHSRRPTAVRRVGKRRQDCRHADTRWMAVTKREREKCTSSSPSHAARNNGCHGILMSQRQQRRVCWLALWLMHLSSRPYGGIERNTVGAPTGCPRVASFTVMMAGAKRWPRAWAWIAVRAARFIAGLPPCGADTVCRRKSASRWFQPLHAAQLDRGHSHMRLPSHSTRTARAVVRSPP